MVVGYGQAIAAALSADSAAPASVFKRRVVSCSMLLARVARIAGGLRAIGVQPGDRVAILSSNSDLYQQLYLAIPWAGGVLAPLNCRWSMAENAFALEDCTPVVLFVSAEMAQANADLLAQWRHRLRIIMLDQGNAEWESIETLAVAEPVEDAGRGDADLLAIFYTGGTTGRPKGVMLSHAGLLENCRAMRCAGLFPDGCRALVVAPLFHLAAAAELTMTMLAGGTAVIEQGFHPSDTLKAIGEANVTDALLVPTMIQMMLDAPGFTPVHLSCMKRIMYGASPMSEATLERIMAAAEHVEFTQAYGMTEVSCTATLLLAAYHVGAHHKAGHHRSAGLPLLPTEVMVADEDGAPVPIGCVGEILVRGPGLMLGYWKQPELTAQALRGGWMHTGDGGRFDEAGLLYVVDRLKDMIVSGGENIYSAEVESAIAQHPAVGQVAVIGVPDKRFGERVHAVIVPRAGNAPSEDEIVVHCRALIADYKCPRSVEFREHLPLSAAGKVVKPELRVPYWEGHDRNVA